MMVAFSSGVPLDSCLSLVYLLRISSNGQVWMTREATEGYRDLFSCIDVALLYLHVHTASVFGDVQSFVRAMLDQRSESM